MGVGVVTALLPNLSSASNIITRHNAELLIKDNAVIFRLHFFSESYVKIKTI